MERQDDAATTSPAGDRGHELRSRFDIDEFSAAGLRFREDPLTFLFRAFEVTAFPRRTAGDEHRPPSPLNGGERVRSIDRVEAHLDHVGKRRGIPRAAKLLHGSTRDRGAQKGLSHAPETKKASSAGAEEAS